MKIWEWASTMTAGAHALGKQGALKGSVVFVRESTDFLSRH